MLADIQKHKTDYSLLALASGLYLAAVVRYQTAPLYLVIATGVFALLYVFWGICHHYKSHSLRASVVLEYFLVAALAVVIVTTLLV